LAACARLGARVVVLSWVLGGAVGPHVRKRAPGVRCDFSALAPGYVADRLAAFLAGQGIDDFLIDVSGELVGRGRNDQRRPWQVAIERPQAEGRSMARVVPLIDGAMATSGDYRNFREIAGQRFTHILDPRSGRPVHHTLASVTVFDELAVRADALSTALMVMGPGQAQDFVRKHEVPVLFLIRLPDGSFDEWPSPAFEALEAAAADP
jgi:thiamine biosynthesis lipoprotein